MRRLMMFACGAVAALLPLAALGQDAAKFGTWGVDLTALDPAVRPGDDFFLHVNGNWLKTAVIPPDRSQTGSFQDLQILSEQRLAAIVADL
jgi:putative endopeptidase